jgi:uncharacterized membrane protein YphA (DoxX/SURF4 family)
MLTSTILLYCAVMHLLAAARLAPNVAYLIAGGAGVFLLLGLWTPLAGITTAVAGVWVFFASAGHSFTAIIVAVLGATVAMIGPGMWSIDARLYGRKHLQDPRH